MSFLVSSRQNLTIVDMDTQKNVEIVVARKLLNMGNVEEFARSVEKLSAYKRATQRSLEGPRNNGF